MAITLRNKVVEAKIREIGKRTGEGPSAVIARAIDAIDLELERQRREREALKQRRRAAMLRLVAELPPLTKEDRAAIDRDMEDMYDEDGLPK